MKALGMMVVLVSFAAFAGPVSDLRQSVPQADAKKRGPLAAGLKPTLLAMGEGVIPELIVEASRPADPSWSESAALAWRVSVLEALGTHKDARARPVFQRQLADTSAPFMVQRAAAEGLAKLGDADVLIAQLDRDAVVAGIGSARTHAVARALALELTKQPSPARAKLLVKALGEVGNAWAWATLPVRTEELATRNEAAKSLVAAYVKFDGEVRNAAATQLLIVDSPSTAAFIAQARAGGLAVPELDALSQRVASKPLGR
ncbi:MAG: hypothetical protein JNK82_21630 [Myxococcaceae bacterium]|nr:hypothetical protein [Myxococcaceae bacterium]